MKFGEGLKERKLNWSSPIGRDIIIYLGFAFVPILVLRTLVVVKKTSLSLFEKNRQKKTQKFDLKISLNIHLGFWSCDRELCVYWLFIITYLSFRNKTRDIELFTFDDMLHIAIVSKI